MFKSKKDKKIKEIKTVEPKTYTGIQETETKKERKQRLKDEKIRQKEFAKEKKRSGKTGKQKKKKKKSNDSTTRRFSINVNNSNIPVDDSRYIVLAVLFQQIRNLFGSDVYCELVPASIDSVFPLPYKFSTFDIVALTKQYKFKELYIEIPDGTKSAPFVSVSFHEIEMQCKQNTYEEIKELFKKLENVDFDVDLYSFNLATLDDKSFLDFHKYIFANLVHIGNELFQEGGYISVFNEDGNEIVLNSESLLEKYKNEEFDYFVIRSSSKYKSIIYIPSVILVLGYGMETHNFKIIDEILKGLKY